MARARNWAATIVGRRTDGGPETARTAELLVSEAVTNAILHTASGEPGGSFTVVLTTAPGAVRIEVHDAGGAATAPRPLSPLPDSEHGRGVALMAALAQEWGVLSGGRLRGVYFVLHTRPAGAGL
ncbi:ATP-binding protein [Nocardiopsis potens]|uniref:ATP-binding protein n=1 Tax=Nocardiopsis potens TaxID=1246458 RepID=UPI0003487BD5|nr:ATP-binding protein [Nocardiopsis potens]